ncbi:hypothetical protein [Parasediminibacterium sp. JCM 36343]|uniref:type IX secretion system periplasmic lipoprotein PorW/SprE n=1 Tax=Parasediminibacterium sp. JCM 36343 TaxID=3374279 RepID=UPI00397AAEC7
MIKCAHYFLFILMCLLVAVTVSHAQPYSTLDLYGKRPVQYQNRLLFAEKTPGDENIKPVKHFFQNTFTHYNYYFNANNKVNDIIDRAKALNKDDYTKLLSFYNYSLDNTSKDQTQIDSVIYKCTSSILLHDLRDDWVDNMYMLMGKAYLLKKNLDSAGYVFQYVNYAWAPKEEGGYDIPIGSNISNDKGLFSVSTIEKRSLAKKLLALPPSRNESLLWRVRVLLEQGRIGDANGLITILVIDPYFPQRLQPPLHEIMAYSFYKQQIYDSAAFHLTKALSNAGGRLETARWEYLIGQMLQLTKNSDSLAASFFEKSIAHTTDPVMEVFARLNLVSLAAHKKGYTLQDNIAELYKLARKDRYEVYRDIIYYAAAILELQQKNKTGAITALKKSLKYNIDNPEQKQKDFLLLADTYFDNKEYKLAYNYYDSTQVAVLEQADKDRIAERKPALKIITANIATIELQDSLQRLANMSEEDRRAILKKLLRQLRKAEGLKETDPLDFGNDNAPLAGSNTVPATLFANTSSGEFYFNNASLKQSGLNEFKSKWGNRPNVDNWQRQAALTKPPVTDGNPADMNMTVGSDMDVLPPTAAKTVEETKPKDLSFEGLMADVPLREGQKEKSDSAIARALFSNGVTFQNNLKDYKSAIDAYEELLRRFPFHKKAEQAHYNLVYCYQQLGLKYRADSTAEALKKNYPAGSFALQIGSPKKELAQDDTTADYQNVYNSFVEGSYEKAKTAKLAADKKYGRSYWTPQLLYIEAVYYVTQREDSVAINRLEDLANTFPKTPLAEKAIRMIELLKRRKEIENHLSHYGEPPVDSAALMAREAFVRDSLLKATREQFLKDSLQKAARASFVKDSLQKASLANGKLKPLSKKDSILIARSKMSLKDSLAFTAKRAAFVRDSLLKATRLAFVRDSLQKAARAAFVRDSLQRAARASFVKDSLQMARRDAFVRDSLQKARAAFVKDSLRKAADLAANNGFVYDPNEAHYAIIQLDNVDNVFIKVVASSFGSFNKRAYSGKQIDIATEKINTQFSFLYFGPFNSAAEAIAYIEKVKPNMTKSIVPWLPKYKYKYGIIGISNLLLLQQNKDVALYNQFLKKVLPGKF